MPGFIAIAIGLLIIYVALSNKGGLVADFISKLFSSNQPPTSGGGQQQ